MYPIFQISYTPNNWTTVPPPRNWKNGIILEMVFTDSEPSATLQSGGFEWCNTKDDQTATNINNYIAGGLTGATPGIQEPPALQIFIPGINGNPNIYLFQGVLDLPKGTYECDKVVCPIKYVNAIDWFHTLASSITYLSLTQWGLQSAGINPPSGFNAYIGPPNTGAKYSYKIVPYLVTQENDIFQAVMTILQEISLFSHMYTAIVQTITDIDNIIADVSESATVLYTVPGVIQLIGAILGFIAQLAWDVILVISIIGSVESLINQWGLLLKYKYAMTCQDTINASFDFINNYLGTPSSSPITFSSSILQQGTYANCTVMPTKIFKENSTNIDTSLRQTLFNGGVATRGTEVQGGNLPPYNPGGPNYGCYGYPDWDFKTYLDNLGKVFNAKLFFINGQVRFEEIHYFVSGNYQLPNVDKPSNDTLNLPAPYSFNVAEMPDNYLLSFRTDDDERTMIVYTGTTCNVCTQPNGTWNVQNYIPVNGVNMTLPFALAKRKEYLNFIEHLVNDILNFIADIVNTITSVVNAILSVINAINHFFGSRVVIPLFKYMQKNILTTYLIGVLETSKDTWQTPKIFIGTQRDSLWYVDEFNGQNGIGTSTAWSPGVWNNPNVPSNTPGRGEGNMSAYALINQFHGKNLPLFTPVDSGGNKLVQINNQWVLYKAKRFSLCAADFNKIYGNNMFTMPSGAPAKFDKLKWNVYNEMAEDVEYRVSKIFNRNYQTIITVDGN